jgi:protein-disulfide isomerase
MMQRLKTMLETLSALVVIAAGGFVMWTYAKQPVVAAPVAPAPRIAEVQDVLRAERVRLVRGDAIAGGGQLAIVEFTDYECPYCARHAKETLPALRKDLIDAGKALYVVVNLPLSFHQHAMAAAEAAECAAEQGKYWEMHDAIFANQQQLGQMAWHGDGVRPGVDGLDGDAFTACLAADVALARVQADQREAARLGVNSTPTVFLGRTRSDGGVDLLRRISGALPAETFMAEAARVPLTNGE